MAKGITLFFSAKQQPQVIDKVEILLFVWINKCQLTGDTMTKAMISQKGKMLHADLLKKSPGKLAGDEELFKACQSWFSNFKKRTGIHIVVHRGKAQTKMRRQQRFSLLSLKCSRILRGYLLQVFNCGETWLFWKKMPRKTFIMAEEMINARSQTHERQAYHAMLFCVSTSRDCKIKPMLLYHSENPYIPCVKVRTLYAYAYKLMEIIYIWKMEKLDKLS